MLLWQNTKYMVHVQNVCDLDALEASHSWCIKDKIEADFVINASLHTLIVFNYCHQGCKYSSFFIKAMVFLKHSRYVDGMIDERNGIIKFISSSNLNPCILTPTPHSHTPHPPTTTHHYPHHATQPPSVSLPYLLIWSVYYNQESQLSWRQTQTLQTARVPQGWKILGE